ncbi:GNAT family N-acetyltransferase [Streptomyces sp. NPDC002514]|uniref:GNAT family N-acetyltransferase n=1 Tax=Streptomyces sp. NPDC001270 TaxID=3364554 RepID=UPI0036CE2E24
MTAVPTAPDALAARHPTLSVTAAPYDHPDARRLTWALCAEQLALYGFAEDPDTTPEADFDPPCGLFLIARVGDEPVGCGGIRLLDEHTAGIKRMYVADRARRHGIGRCLLEHLEQHAVRRGAARIMLETGRRNTAALALCHRTGFLPCPSYVPGRDHTVNRAMTKPPRVARTVQLFVPQLSADVLPDDQDSHRLTISPRNPVARRHPALELAVGISATGQAAAGEVDQVDGVVGEQWVRAAGWSGGA